MTASRYAVVTPTYDPTDTGEVMSFVSSVTEYLSTRASVEVLTTRSSVEDWPRNVYEEGHERIGGIHVRRFTCDRSMHALVSYLERFAQRYDCVIFIGPLDRIVSLGIERVLSRSLVVPFEVPQLADLLEADRALLRSVRAFVFPSDADRSRVLTVHGTSDGPAVAARIVPPAKIDPHRFRSNIATFAPFYLALGCSNAPDARRLIAYFEAYRRETGSRRMLVIEGDADLVNSARKPEVLNVGSFTSTQTWDAVAAAEACIMVGDEEGLESCWRAWSLYKPVIADARIPSIVEECRRSGGGLWYETAAEFIAALELVDENGLSELASQGSRYVTQYISDGRIARTIASVLRQF